MSSTATNMALFVVLCIMQLQLFLAGKRLSLATHLFEYIGIPDRSYLTGAYGKIPGSFWFSLVMLSRFLAWAWIEMVQFEMHALGTALEYMAPAPHASDESAGFTCVPESTWGDYDCSDDESDFEDSGFFDDEPEVDDLEELCMKLQQWGSSPDTADEAAPISAPETAAEIIVQSRKPIILQLQMCAAPPIQKDASRRRHRQLQMHLYIASCSKMVWDINAASSIRPFAVQSDRSSWYLKKYMAMQFVGMLQAQAEVSTMIVPVLKKNYIVSDTVRSLGVPVTTLLGERHGDIDIPFQQFINTPLVRYADPSIARRHFMLWLHVQITLILLRANVTTRFREYERSIGQKINGSAAAFQTLAASTVAPRRIARPCMTRVKQAEERRIYKLQQQQFAQASLAPLPHFPFPDLDIELPMPDVAAAELAAGSLKRETLSPEDALVGALLALSIADGNTSHGAQRAVRVKPGDRVIHFPSSTYVVPASADPYASKRVRTTAPDKSARFFPSMYSSSMMDLCSILIKRGGERLPQPPKSARTGPRPYHHSQAPSMVLDRAQMAPGWRFEMSRGAPAMIFGT